MIDLRGRVRILGINRVVEKGNGSFERICSAPSKINQRINQTEYYKKTIINRIDLETNEIQRLITKISPRRQAKKEAL